MAKFSASVEQWRSRIDARLSGLPTDFMLAWIAHESGGNPCATGIVKDGFVVETGIIQSFHPDNDRFGATSAELRTACTGTSQKATRALTDAEKDLQVTVAINLVKNAVSNARARNIESWPEASRDFGNLVKLHHGLPVIAKVMLPLAAKADSARTWSGFRAFTLNKSVSELKAIEDASGLASTRPLSRRHASVCGTGCSPLPRIFDNAENAGKYWSGIALLALPFDLDVLVPAAVVAAAALLKRGT